MSNTQDKFFISGGTMRRDAPSYITRKADDDLYNSLSAGNFCYVLTSRQMGKSSLMVRTAARLRADGAVVAILDPSGMGQNVGLEQWYNNMLYQLGVRLGMEDELEEFQETFQRLGPLQLWMEAIRKVVLGKYEGKRVVIFIDEIDALRSLPFSTDEFFAGIRELYNRRTEDPQLERLTFCLLGVAAPPDLIKNPQTTPFNIGTRIELTDFNKDEAAPLAAGLGRGEELNPSLLKRILYWTNGQPYLTQRLCSEVAEDTSVKSPGDVDRLAQSLFLVTKRTLDRDINLLFVEKLLLDEPDRAGILTIYGQVHREKKVRDDDKNSLIVLLRLSGVVLSVGGHLVVRNRLYHQAFDEKWIKTHMPGAELRRQQAAYRRGLLRAATLSALILSIMASLSYVAYSGQKEAEQQRAKAEAESENARQHAAIAVREREESLRQAKYANEQRQLADDRLIEADKQRKIAEAEKARAEEQRQHAVAAARREEVARLNAEARENTEKLYREGTALFIGGDRAAAISKFNDALPAYENLGDKPAQAITLVNIGAAYSAGSLFGGREEAIRAYERALEVYRSIPDPMGIASTQIAIGELKTSSEPDAAIKAYQEATGIYRESNDHANEANTLVALSELVSPVPFPRPVPRLVAEQTTPRTSDAGLNYLLKALSLSKDPKLLARAHEQTATLYTALGNLRKAHEHYEEALTNYVQLDDDSNVYKITTVLVDTDLELKDPGDALKHYEKAFHMEVPYISRDDWRWPTLEKISALYKESSHQSKACEYLDQQVAKYRHQGNSSMAMSALLNLSFFYLAAGDRQKATDTLNRAASDYLKDGADQVSYDYLTEGSSVLQHMSKMFKEAGYDQEGADYFRELAAKYRAEGYHSGEVRVLRYLSGFYIDAMNDQPKAFEYGVQAVLASLQADRETRLNIIGSFYSPTEFESSPKVYQRKMNHFAQQAADYEARGDYPKQALFLRVAGKMYQSKDMEQEIATYEKAISVYRRINDRTGEAETLVAIAELSEEEKQLDLYQQALAAYQAANDLAGEAEALSAIATLTKEKQKKLGLYEKILAVYGKANNNEGAAEVLLAMGKLHSAASDIDKLSTYYEQAVSTYLKLNKKARAADILIGLGDSYLKVKGAEQKAHDSYNRASENVDALDENTEGKAPLLQRMGDAYEKVDKRKALEYYKQAIVSHRSEQLPEGSIGYYLRRTAEVNILTKVGDIYRDLKDAAGSFQSYEEALRLSEEQARSKYGQYYSYRSPSSMKVTLYNKIGLVHLEVNGDERKALDYFNKVLSLVKTAVAAPRDKAPTLRNIGAVYRRSDKQKALEYYNSALSLFKSYDDIENVAETLKGMSEIERERGNIRKADDLKKQADEFKKRADELKAKPQTDDAELVP